MKIAVFLNELGLGGTEKAACRLARGLKARAHRVFVLTLTEGPRRNELEADGIEVHVLAPLAKDMAEKLRALSPDVIHAHVPGHPHKGDVLGDALALLPKIPVVATNIFGQLLNPAEDRWIDFRLFISWTSCVQAARRTFQKLDGKFFQRSSVAVYPLDPDDGPGAAEIASFRDGNAIAEDEILFGRLSRPEPNKWSELTLPAFRIAASQNRKIKLLLREPPLAVRSELEAASDRDRFLILTATSDAAELAVTIGSLDAVLHTSSVGESFGYGIAEAMNFAKPVIANSTPWQDQAQIELVRHGDCGFIASTPQAIAGRMLEMAGDAELRARLGANGRRHIRQLADPNESLDRLETSLEAAIAGKSNPNLEADIAKARETADYLDEHQFGHSWGEQLALRPQYYRTRFHQWRRRNSA